VSLPSASRALGALDCMDARSIAGSADVEVGAISGTGVAGGGMGVWGASTSPVGVGVLGLAFSSLFMGVTGWLSYQCVCHLQKLSAHPVVGGRVSRERPHRHGHSCQWVWGSLA
jgi:hypothetical protein